MSAAGASTTATTAFSVSQSASSAAEISELAPGLLTYLRGDGPAAKICGPHICRSHHRNGLEHDEVRPSERHAQLDRMSKMIELPVVVDNRRCEQLFLTLLREWEKSLAFHTSSSEHDWKIVARDSRRETCSTEDFRWNDA